MAGLVGAVQGEVAQGRELGFDPVEPGVVGRGVGDLDAVDVGPVRDPAASLGGQVRGVVVAHDRDALLGRAEGASEAAELQELGAGLCFVQGSSSAGCWAHAEETVSGAVDGGRPASACSWPGW